MTRLALLSNSPQETEELGQRLGSLLPPGSFVALVGGLGSGKTCFTRGIVATVAPASAHLVASPTFAIMNEYPGDPPVYHFDFYRLAGGSSEIAELGFEDYFLGNGVCVAEWPERLDGLMPAKHLLATLEQTGEDQRSIILETSEPVMANILDKFAESLKS